MRGATGWLAGVVVCGLIVAAGRGQEPLSPEEDRQVQRLLKELKDGKEEERATAAQALASRTLPKDSVKVLSSALKDDSPLVRGWVALALLRTDQTKAKDAFAALTPLFDKADLAVWHVAWASAFANIRPASKDTVAALIKLARQRNEMAAMAGCLGLDNLGAAAKDTVALLEEALEDRSARVRLRCAVGLARIDAQKKEKAVAVLEAGLKEKDLEDRIQAGEGLVELDPRQKNNVIAALSPGLRPPDTATRLRLSAFILQLDPSQSKFILPFLTASLKDKDRDLRLQALTLLAERGPAAASAENTLRDLFKDADAEVAVQAVESLMRIRPERAGDLFATLVELRDKHTRTDLGPLLELIEKLDDIEAKQDAKTAYKSILKRIETKVDRKNGDLVQLSAVLKVPGLGQQAREAAPALMSLLTEPQPVLRSQAVYMLGRLGKDARDAVKPLVALHGVASLPPDIREAAAKAIWRISPDDAKLADIPDVEGPRKRQDH